MMMMMMMMVMMIMIIMMIMTMIKKQMKLPFEYVCFVLNLKQICGLKLVGCGLLCITCGLTHDASPDAVILR